MMLRSVDRGYTRRGGESQQAAGGNGKFIFFCNFIIFCAIQSAIL